nr:transcription factor bHLH13-like [Tanacetum cinerariifolium]
AEYIAAAEAAKEAVWIRKFVDELGVVPSNNYPIEMNCDNTAVISMAKEPGIMKGARHFQRKFHYVRECVDTGEIEMVKVHIDDNLADSFTKALAGPKLTRHARSMGLRPARKKVGRTMELRKPDEVIVQLGSKAIVATPIKKIVPLMLQQAVDKMADPKEKNLKEMESERSGSHESTSTETTNYTNNGSSLEKIEIKADNNQVTIRVSCPIDTHPVSKVIQAFKEAHIRVVDLKMAAANDKVFHIFVIKSQGPEQLTKEKMDVFLKESISSLNSLP